MKKRLIYSLSAALIFCFSGAFSQSLTCLSPTLTFSDPSQAGNPSITNTVDCNFTGFIMVRTNPVFDGALTQGNSPCLRFATSLTNTNSTTNNSLTLFQGTTNVGAVCGTCAVSVPNNSLFTLYWPGLVPSNSHSIAMCNSAIAANMTYSVYSCYDNNLITSGTWTNAAANSCQTITIPANTAIGTASFAITPTVPAAAIIADPGSGYIIYDPYYMAAGVYTVTYAFNSQNVCVSTATTTIQINNPFVGSGSAWTVPAVQCPYNSCLSLTAQINGGAYLGGTFSGTGVSSNSFCPAVSGTGSFAVTYSVGVTAVCSATNTNTIVVAAQPTANAGTTKSITCANTSTILSGSGGGTYLWSNATLGNNFSSSQNPTVSISPSTYSLVVNNGTCSSNASTVQVVTNTTPPALPTTTVSNVINCISAVATISATGAGVTFLWSGPGIVSGSNTANPVVNQAGVYSYTVTSTSNGCTNTSTVAVTSNTAVSVSLSTVGVITCVSNTATISGNQPTYGYTWTAPGGCTITSGQASPTINVTGNGAYSVTVFNPANGCTNTAVISTSINTVQAAPNVGTSGTVTCISNSINLSSATGGVTYTWVAPGGATVTSPNSGNTTANGAGVYTLHVTNTTNGCTNTNTVAAIVQTTSPVPSILNSPTITCTNPTVTINGGAAASYTWTTAGGTIVGSPNNQNVNISAPGVYSLSVTSPTNGCPSTVPATVNIVSNTVAPTSVSISPNTVTLSCATPTAVLNATATGATSYSWVAGGGGAILGAPNTTAGISGAGTYSVFAIGANGCASAAQVSTVFPNNAAPAFTLSNNSPSITCIGAPSVTITITSTVPIQSYSWSSPASNTTNVNTFTTAGVYTCVITATNGCISNAIITVGTATTPPQMVAGTGTAQSLSCTNTTTTISPVFTPSANLTYTWSGPGIVSGTNNGNVVINQSGSYSLTVTNTLTGCSTTSIVVPVAGSTIAPSLSVTSSSSLGITCSPSTSSVTLMASSGAAVSYSWNTGAATQAITTSSAGTYTVVITDNSNNCTSTATIAVQNNTTSPNLAAHASGMLPCGVAGTTQLVATSTNTNTTFNWSGTGIVSGANTATATVDQAGIYTITVTDAVTGCVSKDTIRITQANVNPLAVADVTVGPATLTVNFTNQSTGAGTYTWTFGDGNSSNAMSPTHNFTAAGTYTVLMEAGNGICTGVDTLIIKVMQGLGAIPEIFTPNGDGKNDVFEITGLDSYPSASIEVFNRWGNEVYKAAPYKNDWDAKANVSGTMGSGKLPSGTYFYILNLGDSDNTIFKGFIQVQY